jgi:hypothetical protein
VFAEADQPGVGGDVGSGPVERAAVYIEFTLDCWRALPEQNSLALSHRDRILEPAVDKLYAWIEGRGGVATRREIQIAHVAGARTKEKLDALLERYEDVYPGSKTVETSTHGGPPTMIYRALRRTNVYTTVATGNSEIFSDANPREYWESATVDSGNSDDGNRDDNSGNESDQIRAESLFERNLDLGDGDRPRENREEYPGTSR